MLDEAVDAGAARAAAEAGAELVQIAGIARRDNFHIAVLGVAHPAAQIEFAGLALHEPAKAHPLYAALNEKMEDHSG